MTGQVEGKEDEQAHAEPQAKEAKKEKKVLTVEDHNAAIHTKIRAKMDEIDKLKSKLKEASPVKQATLAECNALSRVSLKPQAPAVKLKHAQVVATPNANHLEP